jgi:hypothetical protein
MHGQVNQSQYEATLKKKGVSRNPRGFRALKKGFVKNYDPLKMLFKSNATFKGFRILKPILNLLRVS